MPDEQSIPERIVACPYSNPWSEGHDPDRDAIEVCVAKELFMRLTAQMNQIDMTNQNALREFLRAKLSAEDFETATEHVYGLDDLKVSIEDTAVTVVAKTLANIDPIRGTLEDVLQAALTRAGETRESIEAALVANCGPRQEERVKAILPDFRQAQLVPTEYKEAKDDNA